MKRRRRRRKKSRLLEWVIVIALVSWALEPIPLGDEASDEASQRTDRSRRAGNPMVTLELKGPSEVRGPVARVTGLVTATNAKGDQVSGAVVSLFVGGFGERYVNVHSDGRFGFRTRLKRMGNNKVTVLASWVMADVSDVQTISITRIDGR